VPDTDHAADDDRDTRSIRSRRRLVRRYISWCAARCDWHHRLASTSQPRGATGIHPVRVDCLDRAGSRVRRRLPTRQWPSSGVDGRGCVEHRRGVTCDQGRVEHQLRPLRRAACALHHHLAWRSVGCRRRQRHRRWTEPGNCIRNSGFSRTRLRAVVDLLCLHPSRSGGCAAWGVGLEARCSCPRPIQFRTLPPRLRARALRSGRQTHRCPPLRATG